MNVNKVNVHKVRRINDTMFYVSGKVREFKKLDNHTFKSDCGFVVVERGGKYLAFSL